MIFFSQLRCPKHPRSQDTKMVVNDGYIMVNSLVDWLMFFVVLMFFWAMIDLDS